jgi:hypothetical protein
MLRLSLLIAATVMTIGPASAQAPSISGVWTGGGTVTLPSGNSERVRCRATISQRGETAYMVATCATSSLRVNQTAEMVRVSSNRFSGEFLNRDYGVSGAIRMTVSGNSINASLSGGGGSASISMSR